MIVFTVKGRLQSACWGKGEGEGSEVLNDTYDASLLEDILARAMLELAWTLVGNSASG